MDVSYRYLTFFLEDDEELERIRRHTHRANADGELKKSLIELLQRIVKEHQEKRAAVTEEQLDKFFEIRKLDL